MMIMKKLGGSSGSVGEDDNLDDFYRLAYTSTVLVELVGRSFSDRANSPFYHYVENETKK